ncbi:RNA pseudouridine synthase 1 [Capsicum baccatum]|uniref:RNA pseudouridine synthase 1 n=1 Tax=Capsicum baccatum TaxID=33114 RepID=A0A2G2V5P0_CAPBA|nr:RNA pseudouridine synthase 1 [Capsicum baccatum]
MKVKLPLQIPLTNFFLSSSSTKFFQHHKFIWMASQSYFDYPTAASTDYPVPLSPPLPELSKEIEPHRALTASSKSALFTLERSHVIFEDEWLIAVNKPQGIYCESVLSSLPDLLNDSGDKVSELHLANRLDRDTSGVMLITKLHKVAAKFVKAFTDHKVRKTYLAFCVGIAPKWEKITIKSGHGRSKYGAWRVYAASDAGRKLPGGSLVKDMETSFEVLSVNGLECFKQVSDLQKDEAVVVVQEQSVIGCDLKKDEILVRASPRSGRTHQIRLHCQYLGIPIRGDVRYEGVYEWKGSKYDGHDLHAESLSFDHPVTGKPILLQAPLPSWAIQPLRSQIK